ncbi:MAG: cell division protein FtsB [Gammaproteobacteria bacterium]|nr:MAG: cell division protein FtsB [Gammaproteobacteria bacterium]
MTNWRWYLLIGMLTGGLCLLQYRLWFEPGGIRDMLQWKKMLAVQTAENENLKQHNEELLFQIQRLQSSHDATESRARNELGMIKKGEKFYQIVK